MPVDVPETLTLPELPSCQVPVKAVLSPETLKVELATATVPAPERCVVNVPERFALNR